MNKKLFVALLFAFVVLFSQNVFCAYEGTGVLTIKPSSVVKTSGTSTLTFTYSNNTSFNWTNGKLIIHKPNTGSNFTYANISVTSVINGSVSSWSVNSKSITITASSLQSLTGKIVVKWITNNSDLTAGTYQIKAYSDPDGGNNQAALSSLPVLTVLNPTLTPTPTQGKNIVVTPVNVSVNMLTPVLHNINAVCVNAVATNVVVQVSLPKQIQFIAATPEPTNFIEETNVVQFAYNQISMTTESINFYSKVTIYTTDELNITAELFDNNYNNVTQYAKVMVNTYTHTKTPTPVNTSTPTLTKTPTLTPTKTAGVNSVYKSKFYNSLAEYKIANCKVKVYSDYGSLTENKYYKISTGSNLTDMKIRCSTSEHALVKLFLTPVYTTTPVITPVVGVMKNLACPTAVYPKVEEISNIQTEENVIYQNFLPTTGIYTLTGNSDNLYFILNKNSIYYLKIDLLGNTSTVFNSIFELLEY